MPPKDSRKVPKAKSRTAAAGSSASASGASSLSAVSSAADSRGMGPPPKKRQKITTNSRSRDYAAGAAAFVAENDMDKLLRELDTLSFRPLQDSTQRKQTEAKKAAIATLATIEKISEKEVEKKYWSLKALPPVLPLAKVVVRVVATGGRGGGGGNPGFKIPGRTKGWSENTAKNWVRSLRSSLRRSGATVWDDAAMGQMMGYIEIMSRQEGVLYTSRREKYTATEEDILAILNTFLNGNIAISTGTMRVQLTAITQIIDITAQRPGAIVEGDDYLGTNQCLTWGDLTIICSGYEPGIGPMFHIFVAFKYMKYVRQVDGSDLRLYLRSTQPDNISKDATLPLITLGLERDVFGVDVWKLFDPTTFPALPAGKYYELTIKPQKAGEAVFRNVADDRAMSLSTLNHYFSKAAKVNGFATFSPYVVRYKWAAFSAAKIPPHLLRRVFGHAAGSTTMESVYQTGERGFDLTAVHTGEQAELRIGHLKNSIGFRTHIVDDSEDRKKLLNSDSSLLSALEKLRVQEMLVIKAYGKGSMDLGPEHSGDPLVNWCREQWTICGQRCDAITVQGKVPHRPLNLRPAPPPLAPTNIGGSSPRGEVERLAELAISSLAANPHRLTASSCGNLFAEFAKHHPTDTRKAFVLYLATFIARDRVIKAGKCPSCDSRGEKNTAKAVANLEHYIPCQLKSRPNHEFCPFCESFIMVSDPKPDGDVDQTSSVSDVNASLRLSADEHYRGCAERFLDDRRQRDSASVAEDGEEEEQGSAANDDGGSRERAAFRKHFGMVKHTFRVSGHMFVCLFCLSDETVSWKKRCKYYLNISKLAEHTRSHFTSKGNNSISGILDDVELGCPIPGCHLSEKMPIHLLLTHLDLTHGFEFTICNENHEHSRANCQAELPADFRFFLDDVEESSWPILNRPLPARSVVDRRKKERIEGRRNAIVERAENANKALLDAGKEIIPRIDSNAHLPSFTQVYIRNLEEKILLNPAPSPHIARYSGDNDILRLPEEPHSDDNTASPSPALGSLVGDAAISGVESHPDHSTESPCFDVDDASDMSNIFSVNTSPTLAAPTPSPASSSTAFAIDPFANTVEEGDNPFGEFVEFNSKNILRLIA
ncbi:hypothetical protein BKA70DRAFT_1460742 [Coprinopsis sp. MPI-PUGE-AT-0042]|nr:hypothetical protein BKA70DRAFT_1460742 [Coprinopsis sp. MPI-PUGE-AT-0042]